MDGGYILVDKPESEVLVQIKVLTAQSSKVKFKIGKDRIRTEAVTSISVSMRCSNTQIQSPESNNECDFQGLTLSTAILVDANICASHDDASQSVCSDRSRYPLSIKLIHRQHDTSS